MANPYTSVSASNYNSSPPPDDGSQTGANEVTWSGIKTKLADVLKTEADAINANVLAAFAKMFGSDISSISTDYTVVGSDQGKILACTGTHTISLPAAATIAKPFCFAVSNIGSGVFTIDPSSTEQIDGVTTLAVPANGWVICITDGTAWRTIGTPVSMAALALTGGTSQVLKQTTLGGPVTVARLASTDLSDSDGTSIVLSSSAGHLLRSGSGATSGGTASVSFGTAFPSACDGAIVSGAGNTSVFEVSAKSASGLTVVSTGDGSFYYLAFGH